MTEDTLTGLRAQTQTVRQMASTQAPGARSYIDAQTRARELEGAHQDDKTDVEKDVGERVAKHRRAAVPQPLRRVPRRFGRRH